MKSIIIIAAISSRVYVQAAVDAGYEVIALDAFADADVRAIARHTVLLTMPEQVLDETEFKRTFLQLNLSDVHGFLYASLFDHCPDLLYWVAKRVCLIGNTPDVMQAAKNYSFFKLLDDLEIEHPKVRLTPPDDHDWLAKKIGGTGGTHIKSVKQAAESGCFQEYYFQKIQAGTPISMLFVADGNTAKTIGFNQQLIAPTSELPYRFAGVVGGIMLPAHIHAAFEQAAQKLTNAFNLRGINSLDAILGSDGSGDEKLWALELNPRLSASFQLYPELLSLHMQGCEGSLDEFLPFINQANAQYILYADKALEIAADFVWPDWVADIPATENEQASVKIGLNEPICSVLVTAENAETAHNLVLQRAKILREMLYR